MQLIIFLFFSLLAFILITIGFLKKEFSLVVAGSALLGVTGMLLEGQGLEKENGYIKTEWVNGDGNVTAYDLNYSYLTPANDSAIWVLRTFFMVGAVVIPTVTFALFLRG